MEKNSQLYTIKQYLEDYKTPQFNSLLTEDFEVNLNGISDNT